MAKGNSIVVVSTFGRKEEGIIYGTPKPGTIMQRRAGVEPVNGRFTWEAYAPGTGDGSIGSAFAILDGDWLQGKGPDDAYVSGDRGFLWYPTHGDEFNLRKADLSGTGTATEDLSIGEDLLIVDGTGWISPVAVGIANASPRYPFESLETLSDQAAEVLVWVAYKGAV